MVDAAQLQVHFEQDIIQYELGSSIAKRLLYRLR